MCSVKEFSTDKNAAIIHQNQLYSAGKELNIHKIKELG